MKSRVGARCRPAAARLRPARSALADDLHVPLAVPAHPAALRRRDRPAGRTSRIYDSADQTKRDQGGARSAGACPAPTSRRRTSTRRSATPRTSCIDAGGVRRRRPATSTSSTVARVYAKYQQLLAQNNALDFDDLLLRTAHRVPRPPGRCCEELQERFQYMLIDEYQDTNHAQYVIAHALALEHRNICVVGDPDQSIYAWRGADIQQHPGVREGLPRRQGRAAGAELPLDQDASSQIASQADRPQHAAQGQDAVDGERRGRARRKLLSLPG